MSPREERELAHARLARSTVGSTVSAAETSRAASFVRRVVVAPASGISESKSSDFAGEMRASICCRLAVPAKGVKARSSLISDGSTGVQRRWPTSRHKVQLVRRFIR